MSDIYGQGYGDKHDWQRGQTEEVNTFFGNTGGIKSTFYSCKKCKVNFRHNYDEIPDIFQAMEYTGVPVECNPPNKI